MSFRGSAIADWSWSSAMKGPKGGILKEIWVRQVTDLLNPRIPLFIETMVGNGDLRHWVQVPPGVKVITEMELKGRFGEKFRIPRGHSLCIYSDGTYQKFPPKDELIMVGGGLGGS